MEFKARHIYTHNRMLDAAIYVLRVMERSPLETHVLIQWCNRRGMFLNINEVVRISKSEYENWYEIKGE